MAVYTHIDESTLRDFLSAYDLGALVSYEGIEKGVSNTNYLVRTDTGPYILTIFEEHRVRAEDLPFYFAFSAHLAGKGIACPQVLTARDGRSIGTLEGKPAAIINFLEGEDTPRGETSEAQCREMGAFLARMHLASGNFYVFRNNSWAPPVWKPLADKIQGHLDEYRPGLKKIIFDELDYIKKSWPEDLPAGAIHGDLFPDNVFFMGGKINAVIDFYFACTDFFIFDLAIVINAWCFDQNHVFRPERYKALIEAYESVRPLSRDEKQALNIMCRGTALRYLLSRLDEFFAYKPGMLMKPHDPGEYISKLEFHRNRSVTKI